jgi:hypothetical protein
MRKIEETDDIICNKCGESLKVFFMAEDDAFNYVGLCEVSVSGAYGSKYIGDCEFYRFSLCEKCCFELIENFKVPAEHNDDLEDEGWR